MACPIQDCCLVFTGDDSLLVSGSEDRSVRVRSLLVIFDDDQTELGSTLYEHSFQKHTLRVNDMVWSLSNRILRNIQFPSIIDAITLDPGEHVFYAGGRDGKIHIPALNADSSSSKSHWLHIISSLPSHREDGMIGVWDPKIRNMFSVFKHAKGPVNNIHVVKRMAYLNPQCCLMLKLPQEGMDHHYRLRSMYQYNSAQ